MRMGTSTVAVCALVCLQGGAAAAGGRALTLPEVIARAREQAPQIVSARLALEEARGRLVGASLRLQSNPQIDGAIGNRNGPDTRFTDFELGLGQSFEPGARRSARIAGANAAIAQSTANIDEVTRAVLRSAASSYYRAVHANDRIRLLKYPTD
jgi:outer membrane protein, heavy metal efflux system